VALPPHRRIDKPKECWEPGESPDFIMIKKLKTKYLLESIAFAFVFLAVAAPVLASEITAKKVIELVNIERQKMNLVPLSESEALFRVAERKAADMLAKDYFAHTSPEGKTPWSFYEKEKYDYRYAGENLAINFVSAEKQMDAWMKSETHKKNILSDKFSEIGVAVAEGKINGQEAIVTVQEFGTPVAVPLNNASSGKNRSVPEKANAAKEGIKITPAVLSENPAPVYDKKAVEEVKKSTGKIQALSFLQNLVAFVTFVTLALAPMAFIAKAMEKMWIFWEQRERSVRVRYVN
jgi:uncharacterized protein YkwD